MLRLQGDSWGIVRHALGWQCRDEKLRHKIGDLSDRGKILTVPYSDLWHEAPLEIHFDPERCICCSYQCEAEYYCPPSPSSHSITDSFSF